MNTRSSSKSPFSHFEIYRVSSTEKRRHSDSPTSSILKTPTAIFVTTRGSSTKRLKFANGPVDLQSLKNTNECSSSVDSAVSTPESYKANGNGEIVTEEGTIEVALSPVKTMQVSPDSWKAFLEYKKYNDYVNETEKTDYTYSRLSKFRHKEIIPGFLIRPNLSRASISSSRKSSISLPSDQSTSLNESYFSYDFKVDGSSLSDLKHDYKIPNSINKSSRSKYYLRSTGDADSGETDSKSSFFEDEYLSSSAHEPVFKRTYQYTTGSPMTTGISSHFGSHDVGKTRSLDLDDGDLDEVDDNSMAYHYGLNNQRNEWREKRNAELASAGKSSNVFSTFFTAFFAYLTAVGSRSRDLFSRYILRKKDDHLLYQDLGYSSGSGSPWFGKNYVSPYYSSVRYYGSQEKWYQRLLGYLHDRFSSVKNLIFGSGSNYAAYSSAYGYRPTSSKKWKLWWLLIPFLLLLGSFLGYIDFFSNPKAILNTIYNCLFFFPSYLHYTVTVFIPRLIFEFVPYFFGKALPNLFASGVHSLWALMQFLASPANVWNAVSGVFSNLYNLTIQTGVGVSTWIVDLIFLTLSMTSNYVMLFYTYFCTYSFDFMLTILDGVYHVYQYLQGFILGR